MGFILLSTNITTTTTDNNNNEKQINRDDNTTTTTTNGSTEAITRVFKNKHLFNYILKRIRDDVYYLGACVPKAMKLKRKRYNQLLMDLVWVVRNKHYGVLKYILESSQERSRLHFQGVFSAQNNIIVESATIDNVDIVSLLMTTYQTRFKDYFTHDNTERTHKSLLSIGDFFGWIIVYHGNIDIWNLFINFLVSNQCLKDITKLINNKKKSTIDKIKGIFQSNNNNNNNNNNNETNNTSGDDDSQTTINTKLVLEYFQKHHPTERYYIHLLLKYCVVYGRKDIMRSIVHCIGPSKLVKYMVPFKDLSETGMGPAYTSLGSKLSPSPYLNQRLRTRYMEMAEEYSTILPPRIFLCLFFYSSLEYIVNHRIDILSPPPVPLDDDNIKHIHNNCIGMILWDKDYNQLRSQFNSLLSIFTKYSHPLINLNNINHSIESLLQQNQSDSSSSQSKMEYYYLWAMEVYYKYYSMTPASSSPVSLIIQTYHIKLITFINNHFYKNNQNINNQNNQNNNNICKMLLERYGFIFIFKHGHLELVKQSYQLIGGRDKIQFGEIYCDFEQWPKDISVVRFIIQNMPFELHNFEEKENYLLNQMIKRERWDVVAYLLDTTQQIDIIDHDDLDQDLDDLDKLMTLVKQILNFGIIISISFATVADAYGIKCNAVFKQLIDRAVKTRQASIICFLYNYFKDHQSHQNDPFYLHKVETYFAIHIDHAIQEFDIDYLDILLKTDMPLVIQDFETWRIVGLYGSQEWVHTLLTYTAPGYICYPYLSILKEGANNNHDIENKKAVLKYIDNIKL
ncbi:hypothetical protein DFA_04593 [Cavenderia fasciculata]|uniref:Uncharacterized protein n=1 Tax=Cavenderia fasciculata TaxID=261658 RepID=F4PQ02_CACFS|nr:uncharacterized protein DFA_04593 [Cavenderia fasciculata]EGG22465.1 hypothetical protein DFA_04593 [Cavenderia fasciculata]|eukprot:XP_004360316.1 hypothetical protein DFA_04593 [Cavenderia fasciculata]